MEGQKMQKDLQSLSGPEGASIGTEGQSYELVVQQHPTATNHGRYMVHSTAHPGLMCSSNDHDQLLGTNLGKFKFP